MNTDIYDARNRKTSDPSISMVRYEEGDDYKILLSWQFPEGIFDSEEIRLSSVDDANHIAVEDEEIALASLTRILKRRHEERMAAATAGAK